MKIAILGKVHPNGLEFLKKNKLEVIEIENIENRNEGFTHEVVFVFNAENNQSMMFGWYVNIENGEVSAIDIASKNIQQTVDYFD